MKTNKLVKVVFAIFFIMLYSSSYAQKNTTTNTDSLQAVKKGERAAKKKARRQRFLATLPKNHNPKTAALLALIPGMGQIYNRRYWKLPIVYGGLGFLGYMTLTNYTQYGCLRKAYLHTVDNDPDTNYQCDLAPNANAADLKILRDNTRETGEMFLIFSILFYGLTIGEAFVDAHLMEFDIDDDLSLRLQPQINYSFTHQRVIPSMGLTVQAKPKAQPVFKVQF